MGVKRTLVLGLGLQVAAMPIVEPLLPRPSLPFRARNFTTENQQDSAPSMAGDGTHVNVGTVHDISYHDIERRGTSLDFKVSMPTKGMGPADIELWNTFTNNPLPIGPNDQWIFYTGFGDAPNEGVLAFTARLEALHPKTTFWSPKSFYSDCEECKIWYEAFTNWTINTRDHHKATNKTHVGRFIFDMKLAELAANHGQPVNVIFRDSSIENFAPHTVFQDVEAGILTAPESKIPYLLRWDNSTYESAGLKKRGGDSEPTKFWHRGDRQAARIPVDVDEILNWYDKKSAGYMDNQPGTQSNKGKGREPTNDRPGRTGEVDRPGPSEADSDREFNMARERAFRALKNIADKDKENAITAEDVEKLFDGVADIHLSAFNMLNVRGHLTPEAQSAVASASNFNILADEAWNRFKWRFPNDALANDKVLSNIYIYLSKETFDERGNMIDVGNDKLPLEDFQASTIGPAQIAKAQLASISVASLLMDPEQIQSQSPAVRQIMRLAQQTNIFNSLGVFSESGLPPHLNVRYSGDPASTLAEMVQGGMRRTDWYTEGETLEQVMRHAQLAVNIGPERYDWLLSQDQIPKKLDLTKQTDAIEHAVKLYNPANMPAPNLDPVMDLADAAEMTTKQLLNRHKLIIGGVAGGLAGAGAVLGTLGGLFAGGIFGRKKKRFDPKTQKLADCKGNCKPISNHEYKQKKPQLVESKITTVKYVTSTAKFVTSVMSAVTPILSKDSKPRTSKSSSVETSLSWHSTSQGTQTSATTASRQTSSASISWSKSLPKSFTSFNTTSTPSSGPSTYSTQGTSSTLSTSTTTKSSTSAIFSTPSIMLPLLATSGANQTRASASSIPSSDEHREISTPSPKISVFPISVIVPIWNLPFNSTSGNRTLTASSNETTSGSGKTLSTLAVSSATRLSTPSFSSTPSLSSKISATAAYASTHTSSPSTSSGNRTFPVFGNKTNPTPLLGSISMTDMYGAGPYATNVGSTSGVNIPGAVPTWQPPQPNRHPANATLADIGIFVSTSLGVTISSALPISTKSSAPILQLPEPTAHHLNRTDVDSENKTTSTAPVNGNRTIPVWEAPHKRPDPFDSTSGNWTFTASRKESGTKSPLPQQKWKDR